MSTVATLEKLEKVGFDTKKARAVVEAIENQKGELVTKADIQGFRQETKADIQRLRQETTAGIQGLRQETKADIQRLRQETTANIELLRKGMDYQAEKIDKLREDMNHRFEDIDKRFRENRLWIGVGVGMLGFLITVLKFLE